MEQSMATTQEQLSQRVADGVKLEQTNRKLQTQLKTSKERCDSFEEEISELLKPSAQLKCVMLGLRFIALRQQVTCNEGNKGDFVLFQCYSCS